MPASSGASMHSSSIQSLGNQIGYKVRNIAHYGQPTIDISLAGGSGPHGEYVTSYSTMDTIQGTVTVTVNHDTRFENIDIAFIGQAHVYVDRLTTTPTVSGRTEASHRFLSLKQPIDDADLPFPRILAAGKAYRFPFEFNVPDQLLPRACTHRTASDYVRHTHLMLPPSLGDPELAGFGGALLDDLAPDMSKIVYGIKVRITQVREVDGTVSLLADKMRKVRVKPAFEEQPPLSIDQNDEFRTRHEKSVKKGLFKGKLGTLTAQTAQPKALVIPGARSYGNKPISAHSRILLRFDPADDSNSPPRLSSLATKIKVSTFFASAPRQSFPTRSVLGYDLTQGVYQENISLSNLCIASAHWVKQPASANPTPDSLLRRDSGISDCSTASDADSAFSSGIPLASKHYKGGIFYTAQIVVPISLPINKNFIPTFHSCLISRTYGLNMQLSAHSPGLSGPLTLKVPIQICAEGSDTGNENARRRTAESSILREADRMFVPRSIAPPLPDQDGQADGSDDLPPEYAAFAPGAEHFRARVSVVS